MRRRLILCRGLGSNARPRKKEAARKSGQSLGRKRPRRAYGDKSPRAQNMVRCTKRQEQKLRAVAKAPSRRLIICAGVIFLHQWIPATWCYCAVVVVVEAEIGKITYERPSEILRNIERKGYYTLHWKTLRPDWKRPVFALATRPELAETMRRLNRAKEVDLGLQRRAFAAPLGMTGNCALPPSTSSSLDRRRRLDEIGRRGLRWFLTAWLTFGACPLLKSRSKAPSVVRSPPRQTP
jgi:hypothetical protein